MARIEQSIEVNALLPAVYNQWTQFEQFPRFMEGVQEVRQLDDAHLHWRAERHGKEVEWDSEIIEQVPDQVIAWRDVSGPENSGQLLFQSAQPDTTKVTLIMDCNVPGDTEAAIRHRAEQDLVRFKKLVETQGHESGAWRGEIHQSRRVAPNGGNAPQSAGDAIGKTVDEQQ